MVNLTVEQIGLLPTTEEIEQYKQKGWYITKPIFSEHEIEQALLGIKRHYQGERDTELPEKMKNPLVGACAALLTGSNEIRLFNSVLVHKLPKERACQDQTSIGWHTDLAYFKTCTSEKMLAVWIPLQDSDETMGAPSFLEGSHLKQHDNHFNNLEEKKNFICDDFAAFEKQLLVSNQSMKIVHTQLRKGQCCFLDSKVFHYTGPNISEHHRFAVTLFLQDKDSRFRKVYDEDNKLIYHTNDLLCRSLSDGSPDYSDPTFCPLLWTT